MPGVSLLYYGFPHHSAWSGYERYAEYLGGDVQARYIAPTLPPRWLVPHPERQARVGVDLSVARRLTFARREVVHVLFAEFDHYRAGRLRRIGHRRGNLLVGTFHLPPSEYERRNLSSIVFEHIDVALALGQRAAGYIGGILGRSQVFQTSLGVDINAWHPDESRRSATPTCVFVGNYLRDFGVLEQVIMRVVRENPSVRFELVPSQARADALRSLPNVRARVGISDGELRGLYQRAWVHVLPLTDVVGCNALMEGMACGLPTVTSAVGDMLDYTADRGAVCVAPGDPDTMADAVLAVIGDRQRRERLGHAAREVAESHSFQIVGRRHAEIYRRLMDGRGG
jgi:glycosyltransferase involved in cell wall biosynthesis